MSECREIEPLLAGYADGGAPGDAGPLVEAHVEACHACRDRLVAQKAIHDTLRARQSTLRACAPESLKSRCLSHAAKPAAPAGASRPVPLVQPPVYRRWMPLTAAATLLLAVAAVFGLGLTDKASALAFQATIDHVKCARFNLAAGADPLAAAENWRARFDWPIRVPASSTDVGLALRTVRRCAVTDGRVAHLLYLWKGEPLSVYVLPSRVVGSTAELRRRFGHDAVIWSQSDRTYIVVSQRLGEPALDPVVAYVRANVY